MKSKLLAFFKILAIAYFPVLLLLSLLVKTDDAGLLFGLNLLFFVLYTFPFYCVFLEIGGMLCTSKKESRAQRILHVIRLLICVGILLTLMNLSDFLGVALVLAMAWVVLRACHRLAQ